MPFMASKRNTWNQRERVNQVSPAYERAIPIETDKGHDAFLLDEPVMFSALNGFLCSAAKQRGLDKKEAI